jgi:hypothetical protein
LRGVRGVFFQPYTNLFIKRLLLRSFRLIAMTLPLLRGVRGVFFQPYTNLFIKRLLLRSFRLIAMTLPPLERG